MCNVKKDGSVHYKWIWRGFLSPSAQKKLLAQLSLGCEHLANDSCAIHFVTKIFA